MSEVSALSDAQWSTKSTMILIVFAADFKELLRVLVVTNYDDDTGVPYCLRSFYE